MPPGPPCSPSPSTELGRARLRLLLGGLVVRIRPGGVIRHVHHLPHLRYRLQDRHLDALPERDRGHPAADAAARAGPGPPPPRPRPPPARPWAPPPRPPPARAAPPCAAIAGFPCSSITCSTRCGTGPDRSAAGPPIAGEAGSGLFGFTTS